MLVRPDIELFETTVDVFMVESIKKLKFIGDCTFHYQKQSTKDNVNVEQNNEYF